MSDIQFYLSKVSSYIINPIDESNYVELSLLKNEDEFYQFICIINSLQNVYKVFLNWDDIKIYKGNEKRQLIEQPGFITFFKSEMFISFKKEPSFLLDGFVKSKRDKNDKTLYLYALYMLAKGLGNLYNPLFQTFNEMFKLSLNKTTSFKEFLSTIIITQYPTFDEYVNEVIKIQTTKYYNKYQVYTGKREIKKDSGSFKKDEVSFKSAVLNYFSKDLGSSNDGKEYDKLLLIEYEKNMKELGTIKNKIQDMVSDDYKYPLYKDVYPFLLDENKDIVLNFCKYMKISMQYRNYFLLRNLYLELNKSELDEDNNRYMILHYECLELLFKLLQPLYFSIEDTKYKEIYSHSQYLYKDILKVFNKPFEQIKKIGELDETKYYPTYTLSQLNFVDKKVLNNMVTKIVFKNVKKDFYSREVNKIINRYENDKQFYDEIEKLKNRYPIKDTEFDKGKFRVDELNSFGFFKLKELNNLANLKYLDFGGGIGDIAYSIAKTYKMNKENVFVTDIQNWFGKEHTELYSQSITYRYLRSELLPFQDNMFDFISAFQVFHHLSNIELSLKEINRIMKPGGILLVREHSCENIKDRYLMDLEHSLYTYIMDDDKDFLHNYNDKYYSKIELILLLEKANFEKVEIVVPSEKGPTKYYYSIWKKVEKKSWADMMDEDE